MKSANKHGNKPASKQLQDLSLATPSRSPLASLLGRRKNFKHMYWARFKVSAWLAYQAFENAWHKTDKDFFIEKGDSVSFDHNVRVKISEII